MLVNNTLEVNLDTEIRKLQPAHIYKLSSLLNMSSGWKRLMSVVPKENSEQYKFGVNQVEYVLVYIVRRNIKKSLPNCS